MPKGKSVNKSPSVKASLKTEDDESTDGSEYFDPNETLTTGPFDLDSDTDTITDSPTPNITDSVRSTAGRGRGSVSSESQQASTSGLGRGATSSENPEAGPSTSSGRGTGTSSAPKFSSDQKQAFRERMQAMEQLRTDNQRLQQQLNDANAALAAAQAAQIAPVDGDQDGAVAPPPVRSITVTPFEEVTNVMSAELWVSNLDRQRVSLQATREQMLNAALCALKGKAGRWRQNLEINQSPEIGDYDDFKKAFLKRFGRDRSSSDLLALLRDVNQANNESVRDFADKVNIHIRTLGNTLGTRMVPVAADGNTAAARQEAERRTAIKKTGYLEAFADMKILYFVSGLKDTLRQRVEPRLSEITDFDKVVDCACEFERTLRMDASTKPILSMEAKLDSALKEIAAFKSMANNVTRGNSGNQQSSSGQGNRPSPPQIPGWSAAKAKLTRKIQRRNQFRYCQKCHQWGKHIAPECRRNTREVASLNPMDEDQAPQGEPYDSYYDPLKIPVEYQVQTPAPQGN